MQWASVLSRDERVEDALDSGVEVLRAQMAGQRPDVLLVFATQPFDASSEVISRTLREAFPSALLVGCSGGGVIGGGREVEHGPALALTAARLPGVTLTPFTGRDELVSAVPGDAQALVVLAEPFSTDGARLASALDELAPGVAMVGGLACGASAPGGHRLWLADQVLRKGAVGVAFSGALTVQTLVAQGCRPIGAPMFATRTDGHLLLELDGKPALEVLSALHAAQSPADQQLMRHSLFVGLQMKSEQVEFRPGELLVRNLAGVDSQRRALAVSSALHDFQVVQFVVRDARAADGELSARLAEASTAEATPPAGGLLFSCTGRGQGLFGRPDHDTRLYQQAWGQGPLGGFFCNGEFGPVAGHTYLHGYTSAFALFRPALH